MGTRLKTRWGQGQRHAAGLRLVGLCFLLLFVVFELAHPIADLVHTGHHLSCAEQGTAAHGSPAGEDPVRDAHGPFVLTPALPLPLPPLHPWLLALGDYRPESLHLSIPSPVPIGS